jgi:phospholipid-transporting ATPase
VLLVTACKEAYEDWKRYKVDQEINSTLVECYRFDRWEQVTWLDVKFGEIVRVVSEDFFPADIVLLQSANASGTCSIETANLDGETNLKAKQAIPGTYNISK